MKKILLTLIMMPILVSAETCITGFVFDQNKAKVPMPFIHLLKNDTLHQILEGDLYGSFKLELNDSLYNYTIFVSYLNCFSDSIKLNSSGSIKLTINIDDSCSSIDSLNLGNREQTRK